MEKDYFWLQLRDLPYFRAMIRAVEASYYRDFDLPEPVLDVGCGDGHFATVAFDKRLDVGLDPLGEPIRKAARLGGYRDLVQAEGGRIPFPNEYFASAVSNSVLEHICLVGDVLKEVGRVLKPGSPFYFCVPNSRYLSELSIPGRLNQLSLKRLGRRYTDWFRRMSRVEHAEPPEVWQAWIESAGFELERWWSYFSPQAMRVLEWGHFFGAPTLLPHAMLGRWIIAPTRWNLAITDQLIRPYFDPRPHPQGTFTFYMARKMA